MRRKASESDDVEHRIAGIDWVFNSWGGKKSLRVLIYSDRMGNLSNWLLSLDY